MHNRIVITTQPADQAAEMLKLLKEAGFQPYSMPMIETRNLLLPPGEFQHLFTTFDPDWLVFTSKKGVKGFFANISGTPISGKLFSSKKIAVVGKSTGNELRKYGQTPYFINPGTDAQSLADNLLPLISKETRVLLALGTLAPNQLFSRLSEKASVKRIDVYETLPVNDVDPQLSEMVKGENVDMVLFTSPSGFEVFLGIFPNCRNIPFAAIGITTASIMRSNGYNPAVVPCEPNTEAMVNAIKKFFYSDAFS